MTNKTEVEVLPGIYLIVQLIGQNMFFFLWAMQHRCMVISLLLLSFFFHLAELPNNMKPLPVHPTNRVLR